MSTLLRRLLVLVSVFPIACESVLPPPPEELDLWSDAAAGIGDPALARLAADVWEADLAHDPFQATRLGDPRFHGKVPDASLLGREAWIESREAFLRRLRSLPTEDFDDADLLTAELLEQKLENELAGAQLGLEEWNVDSIEGPHLRILNVASIQPCGTGREREQLVERWRGFATVLRQAAANLERGRAAERLASRTAIQKTIRQLEDLLATPPNESPLVTIATGAGRWVHLPPGGSVASLAHDELGDARKQTDLWKLNLHLRDAQRVKTGTPVLLPAADDPLSLEERGVFLNEVLTTVEDRIYPALVALRSLLEDELLPAARPDEQPGLVHVPDGEAAYRTLIHEHTSLPLEECDPQAIHEYGLLEVARIRGEISALGEKLFGTRDVGEIQRILRTAPEMHFASREEVSAKASEALVRAHDAMRGFFGIVPAARCEVVPVPAYEEKDTTIAYYREPAADGSRPGRYYINTYEPHTRPRYEAEVLAFHEAIPGHHLQIAISQELENLPRFRRHGGTTAFVEGWALYTERLADEMGLYSGDLDRLGVLSFDAWRASRLVVDTGLHAQGWSRERAIEYLFANTLLAHNNVETEVDRYIAWPGQALSYKIGQREILALRDAARATLGRRFSYPEFHDRILENGAVTLASLRGIVGRWLEAQGGAGPGTGG